MQITLKQSHIESAVRAYVAKAGIAFPVDEISFTAGRGKDGMTATIEMQDPFSIEEEDAPQAQPKREPVATKETGFGSAPKKEAVVEKEPEPVAEEEAPEEQAASEPEPEEVPVKAPPFSPEEDEPVSKPAPTKKKESLFS
jgi:outer membrane biosynthesis protein TonB